MVSRSQVNTDLSSITSAITNYSNCVNELASSWKGDSYNNFSSKANDFSSEYASSLKTQFTAFASACDLYAKYKELKPKYNIAKSNYNTAYAANNTSSARSYLSEMNSYESELETLKTQIESQLQSAASIKLATVSTNGDSTTSTSGFNSYAIRSSSPYIQNAINWAFDIANDDTHGYSQKTRNGNPNYDCSSFVINAYENAGIPVKEAGAGFTGNMKRSFTQCGFTWYPGTPRAEDLLPGDVLLDENAHTEMYIGDGKMIGAHGDRDNQDGDSTGQEINVVPFYSSGWDGYLRYEGNK